MHYQQQRPPPTRGIIIVDTSALLRMVVPLAKEFKAGVADAKREINLCGILLFLARNGYEIVIPEMVALESQIARNGASPNDFFTGDDRNGPFARVRAFLRNVPRLSGSIHIAPPFEQDNSASAQYAREIWNVLKNGGSNTEKRKAIIRINQNHPPPVKKNYGDEAACQFVRFMEKPDVPVYYLSEDFYAVQRIARIRPDVPVNELTVFGLYQAMQVSGALGAVGIADIPFTDVSKFLGSTLAAEGLAWSPLLHEESGTLREGIMAIMKEKSGPSDVFSPSEPATQHHAFAGHVDTHRFG